MTQLHISKNIPSIQHIEAPPDSDFGRFTLNSTDIIRLFKRREVPSFELMQIKSCYSFQKRELAHFFINKLEKWNKLCIEENGLQNIRTQLTSNEFIYSSLKRIALLSENEIDEQLQILYRWHKTNTRSFSSKVKNMPKQKQQNQEYQIQKTFKTNAPLLINQYWRKPFDFHYSKSLLDSQKQKIQAIKNQFSKKASMLQNNFITDPAVTTKKSSRKIQVDQNHQKVYRQPPYFYQRQAKKHQGRLVNISLRGKIMEEELRRFREQKEIENQKQKLLKEKSRLFFETSKNFYSGKFETSMRVSKTSEGLRTCSLERAQNNKVERITTGNQKKRAIPKSIVMPELTDITNLGLLRNPQEIKIKKKKKGK